MKVNEPKKKNHSVEKIFFSLAIVWIIILLSISVWNIIDLKKQTTNIILSQARSFLSLVTATRFWNASHAGVYIFVTENNQPNPYLDVPNRDIITIDGKSLTLINPAYMTRQIAEFAASINQVKLHITSQRPIRPGNSPASWEVDGLNSFFNESDEYYSWFENRKESKQFFRYMVPLWTERSCLRCHAKQGYTEGELRGGISVSIPSGAILTARNATIRLAVSTYLFICLLGLSGTFMVYNMIKRGMDQQEDLIKQLENAQKKIKQLKGLIPICSSCKKIRDDKGYWNRIEEYIMDHSKVKFSHSICPDCAKNLYPEFVTDKIK